jgi:hypothetical protein
MNPATKKQKQDECGVRIAPASDNNVMKITDDCLFVRTYYGRVFGGRASMSWWGTTMSVFVWALFFGVCYKGHIYDVERGKYFGSFFRYYFDYWGYTLLIPFLFFLAMFWIFIP